MELPGEYNTLIKELSQGMEKAKLLHFHLCSATSPPKGHHQLMLQSILSSYQTALSILKRKPGQPHAASISISEAFNKNSSTATKKRKLHQPTWTERVRVNSETGLDGPGDDGFSWRKYGQKDILGAKYPRSYYRCTYRHTHSCWATKQVQRSNDNPNVFEVIYKGAHACNQSDQTSQTNPQQHDRAVSIFEANLRATSDMPPRFSLPSTYEESRDIPVASLVGEDPAASGTSYFSPVVSNHMQGFAGNYTYQNQESAAELDMAEIMSAQASTTGSPIGGMDFWASDPFGFDPDFQFNSPTYLM